MGILKAQEFDKKLLEYYKKYYGEKNTDIWYEQPAVNVWVFGRDDKIISLKSHVLTGEVEEYVDFIQKINS